MTTATPVFTVADQRNGKTFLVYRCDSCKALVEASDVEGHATWHLEQWRPR